MDLSAPETWIDLLIAGIGMVAGVVGILAGLRMLRTRERVPIDDLSDDAHNELPPPAAAPPPAAPVAPLALPVEPAAHASWLSVESITQVAPNRLRLSLRNQGPTLLFERLQPGAFNELSVAYDPPIFREAERYATGTALSFRIEGADPKQKTYHFLLFFSSLDGQTYRLEVAGMGQAPPILEAPVPLRPPES